MTSSTAGDMSALFIELGAATLGLALLARFANRFGFSAIPLYLTAGLMFGNGGLLPLPFMSGFVHVGAQIGIVLLLFMLGLDSTGHELAHTLRTGVRGGLVDLLLNFTPGYAVGWALGWRPVFAAALGGVTYVSSSGVVAKVLTELGRRDAPETPTIISILVFEDLAMAIFLPILSVTLSDTGGSVLVAVIVAIVAVATILVIALRFGAPLSRLFEHKSDEILLLTCFGLVLLVAGLAERVHISAAVGAFLIGIVLSGPVAEQARRVVAPLRDLFAAVFFFFFGLQLAPAELVPVLPLALGLVALTGITKLAAGWWAAAERGLDARARARTGATLIARGEFSIVIAGLAVEAGAPLKTASVAGAYVLMTACLGPLAARGADPLISRLLGRGRSSGT